tara:strand:+ start:4001 stop:4243 length:243 start_codon:yes stop_codon:yes gene_type:complete
MGYMNWIYSMIQDGSYASFKKLYKQSKKNNIESFIWSSNVIKTNFAKRICDYVDSCGMKEYNDYIENEAKRNDLLNIYEL